MQTASAQSAWSRAFPSPASVNRPGSRKVIDVVGMWPAMVEGGSVSNGVCPSDRVLTLLSRLGLAIDSVYLSPALLRKATTSILQTRDGLLRAAVPAPIGTCAFLNDVPVDELIETLGAHRVLCRAYPREGGGVEMFGAEPSVTVSDLASL